MSIKVTLIAGARPNFIKISPIIKALETARDKGAAIEYRLVHTGQHYDDAMSQSFFRDLGIPNPHVNLKAGSGTQAEQTASIMISFEKELVENRPNVVMVVGDVNSTLACSIVAKKLNIDVAHVEAGIRSGDRMMPEEINRLVTDSISDYFFTTTVQAGENLMREGVDPRQIFWVGNTMIDTLIAQESKFKEPAIFTSLKLKKEQYLVLTLHRPSNVDDSKNLESLLKLIHQSANDVPVLFPVHPRTQKMLASVNVPASIHTCEPFGYLEFLYLIKNAMGVVTDSGGIQEETTYLHKPCITLRTTTERPETVTVGTNILIGERYDQIPIALTSLIKKEWRTGKIPELWDGKTSTRIIQKIIELYS
ncbi:MAG TPA: UDP-N-acetylglucosamine 2-epimerase (non-hydrolyzing) [Chryseolinea sp.]|nr:UDP-N-acetylglucosamine 2-epimerase (non-hydrolyzing) [Chryseolinea sp.]